MASPRVKLPGSEGDRQAPGHDPTFDGIGSADPAAMPDPKPGRWPLAAHDKDVPELALPIGCVRCRGTAQAASMLAVHC